jgi:uncharacterized membrane protein YbhN (UPF0104 family)
MRYLLVKLGLESLDMRKGERQLVNSRRHALQLIAQSLFSWCGRGTRPYVLTPSPLRLTRTGTCRYTANSQ